MYMLGYEGLLLIHFCPSSDGLLGKLARIVTISRTGAMIEVSFEEL